MIWLLFLIYVLGWTLFVPKVVLTLKADLDRISHQRDVDGELIAFAMLVTLFWPIWLPFVIPFFMFRARVEAEIERTASL